MAVAWATTSERRCSHCLRWLPVTSIKPRSSRCYRCIREQERERGWRQGDDSRLPPTTHHVEVLQAVARTGTMKDAAAALGIAQSTVKKVLSTLYRRLNVETMPEAFYALWLRDLWGEA